MSLLKKIANKITDRALACYPDKEKKLIKKHNYIIHYHKHQADIHTHGITELEQHPELEIRFPLPEDVCQHIFAQVYLLIKDGKRFNDNDYINGIISLPLKVVHRTGSDNNPTLRILIPDPKHLFPGDLDCTAEYQQQDTTGGN